MNHCAHVQLYYKLKMHSCPEWENNLWHKYALKEMFYSLELMRD